MVPGGSSSIVPFVPRFKREECERTKHDSKFSGWKVLIGPSDWENYLREEEGSARYRIHNLPEKISPGVYELGIAVPHIGVGRKVYKPDPDRVVTVYLGKADNVRTRLQQYGRTGAHLSNTCLTSKPDVSDPACTNKGKGFFQEIFSQGYPIVYRWAPMPNKEDAKKKESQLLSVFDYAWNTSNNGIRRQDDIIQKINEIASGPTTFSNTIKLLQPFTQKRLGNQIRSSSIPSPEGKLHEIDRSNYNFLPRVYKFGRSNPRLVQDAPGVIQDNITRFCGVDLGDGSVCTRPPVERRMRCIEHKGMRINGPTSKRTTKSENCGDIEFNVPCDLKSKGYGEEHVPSVFQDNTARLCGVVLGDGSVCTRPPVERRMRCIEHKGMRINGPTSKRTTKSENSGDIEFNVPCDLKSKGYGEEHVPSVIQDNTARLCGVVLGDGSVCTRPPAERRMRCAEHKGMRINGPTSKRTTKSENCGDIEFNVPCDLKSKGYGQEHVPGIIQDNTARLCGVVLGDGSVCTRPPAERRMRCVEHKGMRINGSTSERAVRSENNLDIRLNVPCHLNSKSYGEVYVIKDLIDPCRITVGNPYDDRITNICGIILSNGNPCRRPPVKGRQRCHQHKGKRINHF